MRPPVPAVRTRVPERKRQADDRHGDDDQVHVVTSPALGAGLAVHGRDRGIVGAQQRQRAGTAPVVMGGMHGAA